MRHSLSQSRNTEVSLKVYPSAPFEQKESSSTEEGSELWNLEGLSENLKMLSAWTDNGIVSLKGKKPDPEHYRDDFENEDDFPDYWGRLAPNVTLPFDFEDGQYSEEA